MGDTSDKFNSELGAGEKVVWSGQPANKLFTTADFFLVPFSVLWCGFAIFWESMATGDGAPVFFPVFGGMFVLAGLYFVFGRFIYKSYKQKRSYYAVTNKRVIILQDTGGSKITSAYITQIPSIEKKIGSDGVGSITFGNSAPYARMYANTGMDFFGSMYGVSAPAFYDIKDADEVYQIVNKSVQEAHK